MSPDGSRVAAAGSKGVFLWETASRARKTLSPEPAFVVAFSPDGRHAAAGLDNGLVARWSLDTGDERSFEGHDAPLRSLAFSPDGNILASGGLDHSLRLWDAAGSPPRRVDLGNTAAQVLFSPDGSRLATVSLGSSGVQLWNARSGEHVRALRGYRGIAQYAAFSPDGRTLATASNDKMIRVWDVATGESRALTGHTEAVSWVGFSPDGRNVLSASPDGTVRLWPDDLPRAEEDLRAFLAGATPDNVDMAGEE
jgi:WD40 repeat protein